MKKAKTERLRKSAIVNIEKLLNKDFPEDILDILVDRKEISIDFIDALKFFNPFIIPLLLRFLLPKSS
mgnify:CR=1 FL=1